MPIFQKVIFWREFFSSKIRALTESGKSRVHFSFRLRCRQRSRPGSCCRWEAGEPRQPTFSASAAAPAALSASEEFSAEPFSPELEIRCRRCRWKMSWRSHPSCLTIWNREKNKKQMSFVIHYFISKKRLTTSSASWRVQTCCIDCSLLLEH